MAAMKLFNIDYSLINPQVYDSSDGSRVARQIIAVLKNANPGFQFNKAHCLDLGGASGTIASHLAFLFLKTICLDIDKHAIKEGRRRYVDKKLTIKLYNGQNIPYPKDYFDIIVFRRVVSSLIKPQKLIREIYRVLKPGGLCYFEDVNKLSLLEPTYKLPFFTFFPPSVTRQVLLLLGIKKYYFGFYRTYWGLRSLFNEFIIIDFTPHIVKNPKKYKFIRLVPYSAIFSGIPLKLLSVLTLLSPNFIWVLKKPF